MSHSASNWTKNKENPNPKPSKPESRLSCTQIFANNNPQIPVTNPIHVEPKNAPSKTSAASSLQSQMKVSSGKSKKKLDGSRTKFLTDEEAQARMMDAYNAYVVKDRLPNGQNPTIINCADYYRVSASTLATRTAGKRSFTAPRPPGRPPIFSKTELQKIINHLLAMGDLGRMEVSKSVCIPVKTVFRLRTNQITFQLE